MSKVEPFGVQDPVCPTRTRNDLQKIAYYAIPFFVFFLALVVSTPIILFAKRKYGNRRDSYLQFEDTGYDERMIGNEDDDIDALEDNPERISDLVSIDNASLPGRNDAVLSITDYDRPTNITTSPGEATNGLDPFQQIMASNEVIDGKGQLIGTTSAHTNPGQDMNLLDDDNPILGLQTNNGGQTRDLLV